MRLTGTSFAFFSGCALLAALTCSKLAVTGGGGTEWEAKITGRVVDSLGVPCANARVQLLPPAYDPVKGTAIAVTLTGTTDNAGYYSITVEQIGTYNIEISSIDKGYRSLITGVPVAKDDSQLVQNTVARLPGKIKIILSSNYDSTNGYFYIPGTTIYSLVSIASDTVVLYSIPAGVNLSIYYTAISGSALPRVIRDSVTVTSGGVTSIPYAGWKFLKKLVFNTTVSGAGVAGTVTDFPVLVRLSSSNFDFSKARSGGDDVRFTKSDGTPLPYEIESWDSANGAAVIWVRADTVYGDNGSQAIMIYWGNSSAVSQSNGAAVFDTAAGFQGVWHLGESSGTAHDATGNGNNGTFNGHMPMSVAGTIGTGQFFGGAGDFVDMGSVLNIGSNNFTLSAWVKKGTESTIQQVMAGKSIGGSPSAQYGYSFAFFPADTFNMAVATGGAAFGDTGSFRITANIAITDTVSWHHLVGVIDKSGSDKCRMYIDGIDRSGTWTGDIATVGALLNSFPLRLGEEADKEYPFTGSMDEFEIAYSVRSADWIKLEYMNQKTPDALVEFK